MSETKFTPGPWLVEEFGGDVAMGDDGTEFITSMPILSAARNRAGGRETIATAWGSEGDDPLCSLTNESTTANAHLIAAAPDLYEALAYARRFLKPEDHDTAFVDAALAKAKGETP